MKGTCMRMCPDSEIAGDHLMNPSPFELDPFTNEFDRDRAIKKFHRSDAGREVHESDLRPINVLYNTTNYIIDVVIGKITGNSEKTSEIEMYSYVRDRFRSIRQDIKIQDLHGVDVIDILEKIALFHIVSGAMFCNYGDQKFDIKQNNEQIMDTFQSLVCEYDEFRKQNGRYSDYDVEFRCMQLLSIMSQGGFLAALMRLPPEMIKLKPLKHVLDIHESFLAMIPSKFYSFILDSPPHIACAAIINLQSFLYSTQTHLNNCIFGGCTKELISSTFLLSENDFLLWEESLLEESQNSKVVFKQNRLLNCISVPSQIIQYIRRVSFHDYMSLSLLSKCEISYTPISVPYNIEKPIKTPDLMVETKAESFPETKFEQMEEVIREKVDENHIELPNNNTFDIYQCLPDNIKQNSFVSIIVNDDKCVECSLLNHIFEKDENGIWFAATFSCDDHLLYYSIIDSNSYLSKFGSRIAINFGTDFLTPLMTYGMTSSISEDSIHGFMELLYKAAQEYSYEYHQYDITFIIHQSINYFFESISVPSWRWATGNSVINGLNSVFMKIHEMLTDCCFLKYLMPPIHDIISYDEYMQYCEYLLLLRIPKLPESESMIAPSGTSWPSLIKDTFSMSIDSFSVSLAEDFDENLFLNMIFVSISSLKPKNCLQ